jgi:hypothetical protein
MARRILTSLSFAFKDSPMTSSHDEGASLVRNSSLYREFLAEREEILRHKWIESEKVGYDIGFERALLDWVVRHRGGWRSSRGRGGRLAAAPAR